MHVAEAKRKIGSRISWLCDSMSNDLKHALGNAPNSEFVIDPRGRIVVSRSWSDPEALRKDLNRLVGTPGTRTRVADLELPAMKPASTARKGVVERVSLPGRTLPVFVEPDLEGATQPFYAKLRAEIDPQFFSTGSGKLYLGFFLDPLYEVHWNNLMAPLRFEVKSPDGLVVAPALGSGPNVEFDADADPREFLVELCDYLAEPPSVAAPHSGYELELTVRYVVCDDAETFCKILTQHYTITLAPDRDGGARRSPRRRR